MRKITALLLAIMMLFCMVGCDKGNDTPSGSNPASSEGSTTLLTHILAKERTITETVGTPRNLANTYDALKNKKSLKIGYLGGSITSGFGGDSVGGWRVRTTDWFKKNYSSAEITEINLSIGGTSSNTGLFRLKDTLIAEAPDLIFVEFAMNDSHIGFNEAASGAYMEAIIRETNKALPKTDLIIVFTTDITRNGKDFSNLTGHRRVAEYYGVPCINVGAAAVQAAADNGEVLSDYLADTVHPNERGYIAYANEVQRALKEWLDTAKTQSPKAHELPNEYAVSNPFDAVKVIYPDDVNHDEKWGVRTPKNSPLETESALYHKAQYAEFTIEFEGSMLSLLGEFNAGVNYDVTIDGQYTVRVGTGTKTEYELSVATNLVKGKHAATVKALSKTYGGIEGILVG